MSVNTRRLFLSGSLGVGVAAILGTWPAARRLAAAFDPPPDGPLAGGVRVGLLRFVDQPDRMEEVYGAGLDGRFRQDLSRLTTETLITPNERFYIRTRCPDTIDYGTPWTVRVQHGSAHRVELAAVDLARQAQPMGVHLLECAASARGGLVSAAEWSGVPMGRVLDRLGPLPDDARVLVSGFDGHSEYDARYDQRGASWIFTPAELREAGAFLATTMNGVALPADHGFPVRLVVPGWYGCTCIKWVDSIRIVQDAVRSTPQMRDYAGRTHQHGVPERAGDFQPAVIDLAAMPIRVERWRVGQHVVHRVVGILWGGRRTTDDLVIRFSADQKYVPVESYEHTTTKTWSLWSHVWRPSRPGRYHIQLAVNDPSIRTRRLDSGYYGRTVELKRV